MGYKENHHNTNHLSGKQKEKAESRATGQMQAILAFMKANAGKMYTPFDIQREVLPHSPITSVRRSMTNLTNKEELVKTGEKRMEIYGEPNFMWMYPLRGKTATTQEESDPDNQLTLFE